MRFGKGHGTGNDFILLPDRHDESPLSAELVRALCERHTGLGADGVIRFVPSGDPAAPWFMDHWNFDGSTALMCGNGLRLLAWYLVHLGWAPPGRQQVLTRSGVRWAEVSDVGSSDARTSDGRVTIDMGPVRFPAGGNGELRVQPSDSQHWYRATAVDVGNPHAVVWLSELAAAGALERPPTVSPAGAFPDGVNIEFAIQPETGGAAAIMRVFERGVGETQSCGTGACAVAADLVRRTGLVPETPIVVDVLGGRLELQEGSDGRWAMTGPVTLIAEGDVNLAAVGPLPVHAVAL